MVDQRFPRSYRLPDSKAFERVFNKPDFRVSNKYFLILGRRTSSDSARLGVIVAKKNIARATQRNRIKRQVREAFRTSRIHLGQTDLVIMAKKGLDSIDNSECQSFIHALMEEIEKKNSSH